MAYRRTAIGWFILANRAYVNSTVAFYQVDPVTRTKLGTLATLYDSPTAPTVQPNPYTLDGDGKFAVPIYIAEPVIGVVSGSELGAHETGLWIPNIGEDDIARAEAAAAEAEASELGAEAAMLLASQWAGNPQGVEVEPGGFSARHWAGVASDTLEDVIVAAQGAQILEDWGLITEPADVELDYGVMA